MATFQRICGFETGDLAGWNTGSAAFSVVGDGTAHTGDFHLRVQAPGGVVSPRTMNVTLPAATGTTARALLSGYFRFRQFLSINGFGVIGFGTTTFLQSALIVQTTGQLGLWAGAFPTKTITGPNIALDLWYRLIVLLEITDDGAANYPGKFGVQVDGHGLSWGATDTTTLTSQLAMGSPFVWGDVSAQNPSGLFELDDLIVVAANAGDVATLGLPTADRISAVPITGQGAEADWTGTWKHARKRPKLAVTTAQTTSTNNAITTFTHGSAEDLGLETVNLG